MQLRAVPHELFGRTWIQSTVTIKDFIGRTPQEEAEISGFGYEMTPVSAVSIEIGAPRRTREGGEQTAPSESQLEVETLVYGT